MQLYESIDYAEIFKQLLTYVMCYNKVIWWTWDQMRNTSSMWRQQVEKGRREPTQCGNGEEGAGQGNYNSPM